MLPPGTGKGDAGQCDDNELNATPAGELGRILGRPRHSESEPRQPERD